ncbi:hypothetical protein HN51_040816 [Arachis hypogaea]|uniref:HVA22-like protein n=1 Tax=Arachis hypogaea TaxID=3818 RepID=A0A444YQ28_ARAHY|nr:putative HVA22-like protein g [Arachis ipaensis]XP_020960273.1 putative HVA22-like protein g [Arachis ipaensis]XP_025658067.1 putative HVA22-like protein g [Arachis hypogaea]QHN86482.1 HVA22-like protein i [Arachis hypogaea]RYR04002.1 hypothetical protein Ahy_B06g083502 [Arachis hypogaea]
MLGDFLTRCLILLLGYAYPGFECYKTVEKNRVDNEELRFWCQYWIIVAMFTVLEKLADVVVGWFPLYDELKLALFIYLWYPKTKGTGYVYNFVLRPYVSRHENDIDKTFQEWRVRAWNLAIFYWKNCTELGQTAFWQVLDYLAGQSAKFSGKPDTKKNKKRGNEIAAPSAPPLPSLREALFENGNMNGSGSGSGHSKLTRRNVSDAHNARPVNFHLDPQTGFLHEEEPWGPDENDKPGGVFEKLRRLRKS